MEEQGFYREKNPPDEPKNPLERAMTPAQVRQLLDAVKQSGQLLWRRDHAAIFFGFSFALRITEACLLERKHFRHLSQEKIYIPTLKRTMKVPHRCDHCGLKSSLSARRIGVRFPCARCQRFTVVRSFRKVEPEGPKEVALPFVEKHVITYARDYLDWIPREQKFLLAGRRERIQSGMLNRIFGTYIILAKLSKHFTWHSLRHGRANQISHITRDDAGTIRDFLRQASIASAQRYISIGGRGHSRLQRRLEDSELKGVTF